MISFSQYYQTAKLNGVLFFDYGKGFDAEGEDLDLDLRMAAAGIEVRWISPFGPLRAAFGRPVDGPKKDRNWVFEFSVGIRFLGSVFEEFQ